MKLNALFLFPFAAVLVAGAFRPDTSLTQACSEKSKLKRTIALDSEMESTSFSSTRDGVDMPDKDAQQIQIGFGHHEQLIFTDEYVKVADGQYQKLQRTFDTLSGRYAHSFKGPDGRGNNSGEESKASKLEGKSVVFTRDGDSFSVAFADEKGDEELLEGLEPDLDLAGFLPDKPVADGATWDIEAEAFGFVFAPGGNTKLVLEKQERKDSGIEREFARNLKGLAHGKLKGLREEGGLSLAEIELDAELKTSGKEENETQGSIMSIERDLTFEGTLLWDLKANRARSLVLAAKSKGTMTMSAAMSVGTEEHTMKQVIEFESKLAFKMDVEPVN